MRAGLLLLAGCFHVEEVPICELSPEPVADDVEVAGWTGAELLALSEGTHEAVGTWHDGAEAEVAFVVTRTGDAEHVHAAVVTGRTRTSGIGTVRVDIDPEDSADFVRVPVTVEVSTTNSELGILLDG